jgi:hypothetical protein
MKTVGLSAAQWRKSSRSGGSGGQCVEISIVTSISADDGLSGDDSA